MYKCIEKYKEYLRLVFFLSLSTTRRSVEGTLLILSLCGFESVKFGDFLRIEGMQLNLL